jgi:hypothetical protein
MAVVSFDGHTAFDGRALVPLGVPQQLPAPTLRPHLDLHGALDLLCV